MKSKIPKRQRSEDFRLCIRAETSLNVYFDESLTKTKLLLIIVFDDKKKQCHVKSIDCLCWFTLSLFLFEVIDVKSLDYKLYEIL